jgi:hypothetical protein
MVVEPRMVRHPAVESGRLCLESAQNLQACMSVSEGYPRLTAVSLAAIGANLSTQMRHQMRAVNYLHLEVVMTVLRVGPGQTIAQRMEERLRRQGQRSIEILKDWI